MAPAAGGPYPVIIFSHGNQSSGKAMAGLFSSWAAHGYVCLAPTHDDSVSLRTAAEAAGAKDLPAVGMIEPRGAGTENILNRARDVSFVIDSLAAVEARLHVTIDRGRIGVGGHSSGAYTALLVAGATPNMDDIPRSAVDPRPRAFLAMAGIGSGQGGLTRDSWRNCTRPLMNVTGSLDRVPRGLTPGQKRDPFALSPPGDKFEVYLDGANHGTFTCDPTDTFYLKQLGGSAEQQAVLFDDIRAITLAFWDAELKRSATAAAYLRSGDIARRTGGRVSIESR
jgi:dienelactone hydrolase